MAVIIAGVFPRRDQVEAAINALQDQGFSRQDIGVAMPAAVASRGAAAAAGSGRNAPQAPQGSNYQTVTEPGGGELVVVGLIQQCWTQSGTATPSVATALTCLGVESRHASWYNQMVQQGNSLVIVRADGRGPEAMEIMRRFGSLQMSGTSGSNDASAATAGAAASSFATTTHQGQPHVVSELARVQPGFGVYTSNGEYVGTVQEANADCVHVLCCSNIFVPPNRVASVGSDRLVLNVPSDELNNVDWSHCQHGSAVHTEPGGPGEIGLPPLQHEGGANLPIDQER